jgi:hypothetical protein
MIAPGFRIVLPLAGMGNPEFHGRTIDDVGIVSDSVHIPRTVLAWRLDPTGALSDQHASDLIRSIK